MKLTTKSEYSILALLYLVRQSKDAFIKVDELARECDIPKNTLNCS